MIPTHLFVLVVVPHEGRYLVVEERDGSFYLPAGKVERAENLMEAAVRETAEEAGVLIGLSGILGLDQQWWDAPERMRMRFVFVGYLGMNSPPKSRPDHHSRGARWVTKTELRSMPLRHSEVLTWIERYERATALLPCEAYAWHASGPSPAWSARLG